MLPYLICLLLVLPVAKTCSIEPQDSARHRQGSELFHLGDRHLGEYPPADSVKPDVLPAVIKNVPPEYPEEMRTQKIDGEVWLKVFITKEGKIQQARVFKSTNEAFNQPAIDAVMKWQFKPAMSKGKPVDSWVPIPFRFRLSK
jgi:protein TonB